MTNPAGRQNQAAKILVNLIRITSRSFKTASFEETAQLLVNHLSELIQVDRVALVKLNKKTEVIAVTSGHKLNQNTILAEAVRQVVKSSKSENPRIIPASDNQAPAHALEKMTTTYEGNSILWLPLSLGDENKHPAQHALWLERWHKKQWKQEDIQLLQQSAIYLAHALLRYQNQSKPVQRHYVKWIAVIAVVIGLMMPVTSSTLAPVEVVAQQPRYIFSGIDGIVKELLVQPGQRVKKNELLLTFDTRVLDQQLEESREKVAVAKANLERNIAASHYDSEARAEVPVNRLEIARAEKEFGYYEALRTRAEIRSPQDGMVILDDPEALIGASLSTGEKIMQVADPAQTRLKIMVPIGDIGLVQNDSEIVINLDQDLLNSRPAVIKRIGFETTLTLEQIPSVRVDAHWETPQQGLLPGQRGTATIYGKTTTLFFQVFRKPLIQLRRIIGW